MKGQLIAIFTTEFFNYALSLMVSCKRKVSKSTMQIINLTMDYSKLTATLNVSVNKCHLLYFAEKVCAFLIFFYSLSCFFLRGIRNKLLLLYKKKWFCCLAQVPFHTATSIAHSFWIIKHDNPNFLAWSFSMNKV